MMPVLPERLRPLLETDYPRASDNEMQRRRAAVAQAMAENNVDHLIFYGANRAGSSVQWLTHWMVTNEAAGIFTPGEQDKVFIHYYNHLPLARRMAPQADMRWAGENTAANLVEELAKRNAKPGRVGVIGPLGFDAHAVLSTRFGPLVNLNRAYVNLRRIKSAEELDWFRLGAYFSDLGMAALRDTAQPGVSERELANAIERAYVGLGGQTVIHYIGTTSMHDPQVAVPTQYCSTRRLQMGDIVFAEITATFWDHSGQILRSFTIGEEPAPLYRELHTVAEAAFNAMAAVLRAGALPADVVKASGLIEDAGFTVIDDILHGYGGGYFPPVLGARSRSNGPIPEQPFAAGQLVVIQPNVVTLDGKAGVQSGEMVLITETGIERMHQLPRGFIRL
ncbi:MULTISPECIES: M24 family metallopeptidase [unclassified Beijerinckia]|uniref:M24 family metallopeptidase n=1 Tax=unclassified Beijerinckia TaxID=2638183 RepID=UPI000895C4AD|nr:MULTISPECIES: M24 family metallopeptidase [unclassified Beijerinckia]MDH7794375.1 Xaa-Pro dipeptidase [Beijerinckia sp. GAS462]SEB60343.1 Xaa-Pro aminopeptidase [Beijerinckia sp. 28-YEA-48]